MKEKKSNSGVVVDPAAETTFLHGSTCVVWEGELYTYGGLGEYGEFVDSITRWSGRGENREVTPQNKNMKTDVPPGRYGHTATMSGDCMYVFGGQGRYGAMNDLWCLTLFERRGRRWIPSGGAQRKVWALRVRFRERFVYFRW